MATVKKRINVSLSDQTTEAITKLSQRNQVPPATMAATLIETALELEEDQIWDDLAKDRDSEKPKFVGHKNVWG